MVEFKYKEDLGAPKQFKPGFSGPISKRRPRDICCLLIFILFWIGIFIAFGVRVVWPGTRGNPMRIFQPLDNYGRFCGFNQDDQALTAVSWDHVTAIKTLAASTGGVDAGRLTSYTEGIEDETKQQPMLDMTSYSHLWFPVTTLSLDDALCVKECPNFSMPAGLDDIDLANLSLFGCHCHRDYGYLMGSDKQALTAAECSTALGTDLGKKLCYRVVYDSQSSAILGNRCWPGDIGMIKSQAIQDTMLGALDATNVGSLLLDLPNSWYFILIGLGIAVSLAFAWLVFMRFFAKVLIWVTVWLLLIVTILIAIFFSYQAYTTYTFYSDLSSPSSAATRRLAINIALAVLPWLVAVIYIALICFFAPRVNLALAIIQEASKAIASMPTIVFLPFVFLIIGVVLLGFVGTTTIFALSAVEMTSFMGHRSWELRYYDYAIMGFLTFCLYWVGFFVMGVCQTVIAGAIAQFYWRRDKATVYWLDIPRAIFRTIAFHLGSIAFGSFLIATIAWLRFVLNYIKKRVKAMETPPAKTLMRVVNCLMYIFEKIIKYITRMAYIEIAVYGYGFCTAAKRAVQQLLRNIARVAAINVIGDSLLVVGKLFVAIVSGFITGLMTFFLSPTGSDGGFVMPMVIVGACGYGFAHLFMSVYEMAIDTTFMCFCEDIEKHNGTPQRPYWCGPNLRKFLDH